MTAVIALLALLLVSVLLCLAARFFFRYTFLRAEKPEPWCDEEGVLKDRAFYERPDRQVLEMQSRDGLTLRALLRRTTGSSVPAARRSPPSSATATAAGRRS